MVKVTRRSPVRHTVQSHKRQGKQVQSFERGTGQKPQKLREVVRKKQKNLSEPIPPESPYQEGDVIEHTAVDGRKFRGRVEFWDKRIMLRFPEGFTDPIQNWLSDEKRKEVDRYYLKCGLYDLKVLYVEAYNSGEMSRAKGLKRLIKDQEKRLKELK